MAKSPLSKRDEKRELSRRALIKWSVAAGAALGVSRSKIFDILENTAGRETAEAAAASLMTRSVHIVAGNGGLAWFGLLWPQNAIAAANNATFAWHKPGMSTVFTGTDNMMTYGPDTPWTGQDPVNKLPMLAAARQPTIFLCGSNETHTQQPQSSLTLNGANIFSVASALQASSPSVIPLITVGNVDVGTAPGAARASNVTNAAGITGLFNSAASRAGGLLSKAGDAQLYKAQYDGFTQLNRAANRSTTKIGYTTASGAAGFLGTNLAAQLTITPADNVRYGITASTRSTVTSIANTLIIAVKAFKMGLTNSIVFPAMDDDPHGAFTSGDVNTIPAALRQVFDGFMYDLTSTVDDVTQQSLADDTVISIHGDTMKQCTMATGWPDGTASNSNVVYVYGAGNLKTGWYGGIDANNKATGFGADGKPATYAGASQATIACASIGYAIAKRDDRAIGQFANGVTISGVFGEPKDQ